MDRQEFEAAIEVMGPKEAWARIFVPFDVRTCFRHQIQSGSEGYS